MRETIIYCDLCGTQIFSEDGWKVIIEINRKHLIDKEGDYCINCKDTLTENIEKIIKKLKGE